MKTQPRSLTHALTQLRSHAGSLVVDSGFRALAHAASLHPKARPERHDVTHLRDIAYGPAPWAKLDVYKPLRAPAGGSPAVLYVHGGGFRILSKDTHWVMGLAFARAGYTVFSVDYRLAPKDPFPAAVQDVCEAYGWLASQGQAYGADLSRLVIAGESAGANLALTLAMCALHPRSEPYAQAVFDSGLVPKALVPMCGILQVSDTARFVRRKPSMSPWISDRLVEVERTYLERSPIAHDHPTRELADPLVWLERAEAPARALPALFAAVGTRDPLLDDTRRLAAAWRSHGAPCEALMVPGEVHAYHAFVWRQQARETWRRKLRFLDDVLQSPTGTSGSVRR
ncbi:MAG: alpha/beta hydrolase [Deltaproteobacteria bacterium]|nr:alpha/beta hydrolase [Deltaproteobacteria bacterium]